MSQFILKNCPFCDHPAKFDIVTGKDGEPNVGGEFVTCTNNLCGASTLLMFACGDDPRPSLASIWNKRTPSKANLYVRGYEDGMKKANQEKQAGVVIRAKQ